MAIRKQQFARCRRCTTGSRERAVPRYERSNRERRGFSSSTLVSPGAGWRAGFHLSRDSILPPVHLNKSRRRWRRECPLALAAKTASLHRARQPWWSGGVLSCARMGRRFAELCKKSSERHGGWNCFASRETTPSTSCVSRKAERHGGWNCFASCREGPSSRNNLPRNDHCAVVRVPDPDLPCCALPRGAL